MPRSFIVFNGASPTTAAQVPVATGTAIKTMLQVAVPATTPITLVEWGISFNGSAAATPGTVELIQTDVAASTGTAVTPTVYDDPNSVASLCIGGAALTCFSPTAEGTITATRVFDAQLIAPTNQYVKQFPLGREPQVIAGKFLRIRVTFAATVNAICYVVYEE